ncbi:MAG: hypothetical protein F7C35_07870 [Desulfurococcales archaeon]|nr:hypothetical protein [Desulfurococcales archaeon]
MARVPESLLHAALCVVAVELNYSLAKNVRRERLIRVLRNKLPGHESLAREILEELVRQGYLTMHGGRKAYMLTNRGRSQALKTCKGGSTKLR